MNKNRRIFESIQNAIESEKAQENIVFNAKSFHFPKLAREVEFICEELDGAKTNNIMLDGYICKLPVYRKTPLGREIADLLIAVNRPYGKSDYIPCICWGRNARFASAFEVGNHVQVFGRIQSREYVKKLTETESERRTAYEVSVSKLECVID